MIHGSDQLGLMFVFVRIVRAGSISAAAQQLQTTQPTVSRQLQALEGALGLQLLARSTHRMSLTDAGLRYYEYAQKLLDEMDAFEAELRGQATVATGALRVVVPSAFGQDWMIEVAARYLKENPEASLEWQLGEAPIRFIEQSIDCVVRIGEPKEEAAIAQRVGEIPRVLVASPGLLAQHEAVQHPEDLVKLPWVALSTVYTDTLSLQGPDGDTKRISITPRFITDHILASRGAVLEGVGAVSISEWAVREDLAAGRLQRLVPDWSPPKVPLYVIFPKSRFYPAKLRNFISIVKSLVPARLGGG